MTPSAFSFLCSGRTLDRPDVERDQPFAASCLAVPCDLSIPAFIFSRFQSQLCVTFAFSERNFLEGQEPPIIPTHSQNPGVGAFSHPPRARIARPRRPLLRQISAPSPGLQQVFRRAEAGPDRCRVPVFPFNPASVTLRQNFMRKNLYMVVEQFKNKDAVSVYRRFRDRGRMAPEGLVYVSSWVDNKLERCYQLMETYDPKLLDEWIEKWNDLVEFEVFPVMTSAEAVEKITPQL
jgi:hypothetical protein